MKVDRRMSPRSPFSKMVNYIALGGPRRPADETSIKAKAFDLSNKGMRIQTMERSLTEGAVIQIRIPVTKSRLTVPTLGIVKWSKKKRPKGYQVGLRFLV